MRGGRDILQHVERTPLVSLPRILAAEAYARWRASPRSVWAAASLALAADKPEKAS